jgi:hypothetical protein
MALKPSSTGIILKILAWLSIVGGVMSVFGGLVAALVAMFVPFDKMYANMPNVPPGFGERMQGIMHMEAAWVCVMVPMAVAAGIGGIGILRRRAWGLKTMEIATWLYLAAIVGSTIYMNLCFDYSAMMPNVPNMDPAAHAQAMQTMGIMYRAISILGTLFWSAILAAVLWFLRSQSTRDWFARD